eukprot:2889298-Amphidinium_carterae.1
MEVDHVLHGSIVLDYRSNSLNHTHDLSTQPSRPMRGMFSRPCLPASADRGLNLDSNSKIAHGCWIVAQIMTCCALMTGAG